MIKSFSYLTLAILLTIISSSSFAQRNFKDRTEEEIKTLLCNNWQITSIEMSGEKKSIPLIGRGFMNFTKNGVLTMSSAGDDIEKFTWRYQHNLYKIHTAFGRHKDYFTILNITTTELVLLHTSEGYPVKIYLKHTA